MPIIDLNTGEITTDEVKQPQQATATQAVEEKSGGIINLETGDFETQNTVFNPAEERTRLLEKIVSDTGPLDSALISAGKTTADLGRFLGFGEPESEQAKQALSLLREDRPISTAVGQALPFLAPGVGVANIGSFPARVLAATGLGGAEGATIASGTGQDVFKGTGIGALVGGGLELVFPVIGRLGGQLFRKLTGRSPEAPIVNSVGNPSTEFQQALDSASLSFDDVLAATSDVAEDTTQIARRSFLEENGLIPTRAQVTGRATDFQAQQELNKTSGRVRSILEGQEGVLANRFENAITQTGGTANPSNSPVFDFVGDKAIDLDSAIGDAYTAAKQAAGTESNVKVTNLIQKIRDIAGSNSATGGLAGAARDILREKGLITGRSLNSSARINPTQAEGVRQDLNALFDSLTDFGRSKLSGLKDALDSDVARDVGEEAFKDATAMKAKFEKDLRRVKLNKFDKRKANLLRDILENKISPERFLDEAVLARKFRSTDLEQVKRYLLLDDNPAGVAAFNDLRAEAMQRIASDSMPQVGGQPALTRSAIDKAKNKFGRDKLRVLFNENERDFLNSMSKVAELREPVRMTQQGRGPSAQAVERLASAMEKIPLVADSFRGIAERIANNKALELPDPIRNKLLRSLQPAISGSAVVATQQQQENN